VAAAAAGPAARGGRVLMAPTVEVRAVQAEQVVYGALVLGLIYCDPSDPYHVVWRWITRRAWGAAPTREAALLRVAERVQRQPAA
jgi:hypothetical protein